MRANILMAYPYLAKQPAAMAALAKAAERGYRVMIDSGAFTAHQSGKPINVRDYIAFLRSLPFTPDCYVTLDVIGDPVGSQRNLDIMRDAGLTPMPVFTYGDTPETLDEMFAQAPVVAVGGLVGRRGKLGYLQWVSQQTRGRPVHLLGNVTPAVVSQHRPFAADASNFLGVARFGQLALYEGRGQWTSIRSSGFKTAKPSAALLKLCTDHGLHLSDLSLSSSWRGNRSMAQLTSTMTWLRYAHDVEHTLGTRIFLACATSIYVEQILDLAPIALLNTQQRRDAGKAALVSTYMRFATR